MNTLEKLNKKFNNKYNYLKLLSVVYDMETLLCTITFLYPYQIDEISSEDREEVYGFYKELLGLNGELKIKYKKSFLDERLIVDEVIEYFKVNKKGIFPYINIENISSSHVEQEVKVTLKLNQDIISLIDDFELSTTLKAHLESLFIANVTVEIIENEEVLPDEIDFDDIPPSTKAKVRRYKVRVDKKVIGNDINPQPEFISDIKSPKASVILFGILTNKNMRTFKIKTGKHIGEDKALYTFTLKDKEGGSIDCVYFCPKAHEKIMEALEEQFMILCLGDVENGLSGKLTYKIKKISLASPIEFENKVAGDDDDVYVHKQVVFPEQLPRKSQINLFETKAKYNDFIMKNNIVVFDIETTGLDAEICEITELGAVKIVNGEITERFSSFAKTKFSIPEEVQQLTHITNEMIKFAPRVEDVVYDFYEWSRGCIISGYNIIGFDLKFIQKVASRIGVKFDNDIIDAYIVARQSPIRAGNYKLGTVVKALGLKLEDAHRAYNDAYATALVLMELNKAK